MDRICLNHTDVLRLLPNRKETAHKGDFGRILLLCGSRGFTGAAALAAMGALRSGAGLVFLGVPESIYAIEAMKLNEAIVFPLPDSGGILSSRTIRHLRQRLTGMNAVLIGPGLGMSKGAEAVVKFVLQNFAGPVVLDADGINLMRTHKDILRGRTGTTILTPHEGEFHRFTGEPVIDRLLQSVNLAKDLGVIVLLKGSKTLVTDGVTVFENCTGNPGMAVGGSGDMLAGMITSFLGQKIPALEATAAAAYLHGLAADTCACELGQYGMLPTDMLNALPRLMK